METVIEVSGVLTSPRIRRLKNTTNSPWKKYSDLIELSCIFRENGTSDRIGDPSTTS